MALQLDEVRPEPLEVENEGVGCCVDVQRLDSYLLPAPQRMIDECWWYKKFAVVHTWSHRISVYWNHFVCSYE